MADLFALALCPGVNLRSISFRMFSTKERLLLDASILCHGDDRGDRGSHLPSHHGVILNNADDDDDDK